MNGKLITHHYTESGLPNIWIQCRLVKNDANEDVFIIPKINLLHKLIARKIVMSDSTLTGPELKFLRSEMGLTQAELGELIHRKRLTIARWENEESRLDGAVEALVRILASSKLKLFNKIDPEKICRKHTVATASKNRIHINMADIGLRGEDSAMVAR